MNCVAVGLRMAGWIHPDISVYETLRQFQTRDSSLPPTILMVLCLAEDKNTSIYGIVQAWHGLSIGETAASKLPPGTYMYKRRHSLIGIFGVAEYVTALFVGTV